MRVIDLILVVCVDARWVCLLLQGSTKSASVWCHGDLSPNALTPDKWTFVSCSGVLILGSGLKGPALCLFFVRDVSRWKPHFTRTAHAAHTVTLRPQLQHGTGSDSDATVNTTRSRSTTHRPSSSTSAAQPPPKRARLARSLAGFRARQSAAGHPGVAIVPRARHARSSGRRRKPSRSQRVRRRPGAASDPAGSEEDEEALLESMM